MDVRNKESYYPCRIGIDFLKIIHLSVYFNTVKHSISSRSEKVPRIFLQKLPKNNPYVGNFTHDFTSISKETFSPTVTLDKLMIYFKTIHTKCILTRNIGTQTTETGDSFIVLNLLKNEEKLHVK